MITTALDRLTAIALVGLGLLTGAMGIYVADVDDAPGAAAIGLVLLVAGVVLGVQTARNRLSRRAARTALVAGLIVTAFAAFLMQQVVNAPRFGQPEDVPSAMDAAPSLRFSAAVERARPLVRAAIVEQNLPGVSVAVATGGTIVWAEGFGWRDVVTRTPVTPATRFAIGTAASVVADFVGPLGLTNTGADSPGEWSPEHIGEPEEDPPPFTLIREVVFRPIGLAPAKPLPGDRATSYVPRSVGEPGGGRRLMYMRDLACCPEGQTPYSTPSDLVRFAMATTPGSLNFNGELAGGLVMSLVTREDLGLIVAVTSNLAHADTVSLARRIADAFASRTP